MEKNVVTQMVVPIVAFLTCLNATVVAIGADGRSNKRRRTRIFTIRNNVWEGVEACPDDGWYRNNLLVSRSTFNHIVQRLEQCADENGSRIPASNAFVDMRMRTAMALQLLSQDGGFIATAAVFGVSKPVVITNVNEVLDILICLAQRVIQFSATRQQWIRVASDFEEIRAFPDVDACQDGSLFEIERPYEYDGWICRKGFAAINMQASVDVLGRVMEYSLRPGSCSDKNVWKMSSLGGRFRTILPADMHFIGDSGYTLTSQMLTPYVIYEGMPSEEKNYNKRHSQTRIDVERAFGGLKGRWRLLKRTLNMKSAASCGRTIVAAMVLHNLTIDAGDDLNLGDRVDPYLNANIFRQLTTGTLLKIKSIAKPRETASRIIYG